MKKLLQLKTITFLSILVLLFSGRISAQELIIYVADTNSKQILPPDGIQNDSLLAEQVTIDIFLEDGYEVQVFHTRCTDL